MFCKKCGAHIPDGQSFCDKCGCSQQNEGQVYRQSYAQNYDQEPHKSGMGQSIGGMVCGILGIIGGWIPVVTYFTTVLAIIGIVLSAVALKKNAMGGNKGMAIAGLVCGIIGTTVGLSGIICTLCVLGTASGMASSLPYFMK